MQVKEVKPGNFLFYREVTSVEQLSGLIPIAKEVYREAVDRDLHITGPIHWHYHDFFGLEKPFTLEISLPVAAIIPDYDGRFHFKRTQPFKCVSVIHEGDWLELPRTYGQVIQFMEKHKMEMSFANREIYMNSDFENPEANITEVQIGIR